MRSFSNLWFWIALAVMWSTTSHWVLGVPFDMMARARREGGQAAADFETMVRINVGRMLYIGRTAGIWLAGFTAFVLTALAILGFGYEVEFAQAVFCLGFPISIVGLLSLRTALRIEAGENSGAALYRRMTRHRFVTQLIGMVSIFCTAMWGMWQNMMISVLGG
jgi:hypothetical protein